MSTQSRVYSLTDRGTLRPISAIQLENAIPGFRKGVKCVVRACYHPSGAKRYHLYNGGSQIVPTAPLGVGSAGRKLILSLTRLTPRDFAGNLPRICFKNRNQVPWMASRACLTGVSLGAGDALLSLEQEDWKGSVEKFTIAGTAAKEVSSRTGQTSLDISILDFFGIKKILRVYHDGGDVASAGFCHGARFDRVSCMGYDGVRFRIGYRWRRGEVLVSTIYAKDPKTLYRWSNQTRTSPRVKLHSASTVTYYAVRVERDFERKLIEKGSGYEHGRLGAEIAYTLATTRLGYTDVKVSDPARPGIDLDAPAEKAAIEARLLTRTRQMTLGTQSDSISRHLNQMVLKLKRLFAWNKAYGIGHAILTFEDTDGELTTVIVTLENPQA